MSPPPGEGDVDLPRGFMRGVSPPRLLSHGGRGVNVRTGNATWMLEGEPPPSSDIFCSGGLEVAGEAMGTGIASKSP